MDLRSWTLSTDLFAAADAHWPADALLMASSSRHVALARRAATLPGDQPWTAYDAGHVFTATWHAKWRRLGTSVRVVLAGPVSVPGPWPEPDHTRSLDGHDTEAVRLVLWGRQQNDEALWVELRVPHLMSPPDQQPSGHVGGADLAGGYRRRVLEGTTYRHPDTQAVFFTRYQRLRYAASDANDAVFEIQSS